MAEQDDGGGKARVDDWGTVLDRELHALQPPNGQNGQPELSALCLSGGGIRSASFCIGAMQALAKAGLLRHFHYLSTVSGGGFAGGWLQMRIAEKGLDAAIKELTAPAPAMLERLRSFTNYLTPQLGLASLDVWAGAVLYLRNLMINWLMFLPVMIGAVIAAVLARTLAGALANPDAPLLGHHRGLLAGLLLGVGFLCLAIGTYHACRRLPSHVRQPGKVPTHDAEIRARQALTLRIVVPTLAWSVCLSVVLGIWLFVGPDLPAGKFDWNGTMDGAHPAPGLAGAPLADSVSQEWTRVLGDGTRVTMTARLPAEAIAGNPPKQGYASSDTRLWEFGWREWSSLGVFYVLAMLGGYVAAWLRSPKLEPGHGLYRENIRLWSVASLLSGVVLTLAVQQIGAWSPFGKDAPAWLLVFGPTLLVLLTMLQATLFVSARQEARQADMDREWLARVNAAALQPAVLWMIFGICTLLLPAALVLESPSNLYLKGLFGGAALLAGPLAAWLGHQIASEVTARLKDAATGFFTRDRLLKGLAVFFAVALLIWLGSAVQAATGVGQRAAASWLMCNVDDPLTETQLLASCDIPALYFYAPALILLLAGLVCWIWLITVDDISVNRFSLHGIYRNRLARAFLGSARDARPGADPFVGFDGCDNPRLARLWREPRTALFPVINMALNLTDSDDPALSERKAMSFTATPFASGAGRLPHPDQAADNSLPPRGAFVDTSTYAWKERPGSDEPAAAANCMRSDGTAGCDCWASSPGAGYTGISLATVMTISGAAASPNFGYHSSPLTAFLMTLFNVRLGAWLPNPAVAPEAGRIAMAHPRNAIGALLNELGGRTNEYRKDIYLSDGGHFDNLGVYEMIRRRCTWIVAIDASCDESCDLFDLGMSLRKATLDFSVTFTAAGGSGVASRKALEQDHTRQAGGWNVYSIDYPPDVGRSLPAAKGLLLYVKASLLRDLPPAVRAYATSNPTFPHETTVDQWFTESQFESYRNLGEHQMRKVVCNTGSSAIKDLIEAARHGGEGAPA